MATSEAMRRIRDTNPAAELVQTEDFGRIFATLPLGGQAAYENERRFLGLDLLMGAVDQEHYFWRALVDAGVPVRDLERLAAEPCPPAIVGIDHYLTSDRFLDHRIKRYPGEPIGGNGRQAYVDLAAVHLPALRPSLGILARVREVRSRYALPIVLTEVHNGCTRDEQLRWLLGAWRAAHAARAEGIAVQAVTLWSLFGALDWNSVLTDSAGHYESGAFDIRTEPPGRTALARAAAALTATGDFDHPVLTCPGWWCDDAEAACPPLRLTGAAEAVERLAAVCASRRVAVATGPGAPRPWGELAVALDGGRLRFVFRPNAGECLRVEVAAGEDFGLAAHAALDLAIDGEAGLFRLEALGPACQFRILRDGAAPRQVQAGAAVRERMVSNS